jgi:peptidoglycan/xylan/chitin deacetylase (PgdA/CDA1 family)
MKKKLGLGMIAVVIILIVGFFLTRPTKIIEFNDEAKQVEINSIVDYNKFIKDILVDDKNVEIDDSQVKYDTLGNYNVIYKIGDKTQTLKIEVVDTIKPKVTLKTKTVIYDYPLKADELVNKIVDETKTEVSFKEDYSFTHVGENEVVVVVKDEGGNITEESTTVTVLEKDEEKPTINTTEIKYYIDSNTEIKDKIDVTDNQDKNVKVSVDETNLDKTKAGDYTVTVTATDASGNVSTSDVTVHVSKRDLTKEKIVYLTFDDGPSKYTPDVLKILDKYNIKASFFVTGINKKYYSYMKTIVDKGHTIGLHTYSHEYGTVYASIDAYFKDLEKIYNLVEKETGVKAKYIRFPGGSSNTVSRKYTKKIMSKLVKMVEEKGYSYFDWNCENGDGYSKMGKTEMIKRATSSSSNHIMILMHDANGKQNTVDTLSTVIEYYKKKGYEFKAIDDETPIFHQHVNN